MQYSDTLAPWQERFCKEYWELDERIKKLDKQLHDWNDPNKKIDTVTSYNLLNAQEACMMAYKSILMERSTQSNIDLFKWREEHEEK